MIDKTEAMAITIAHLTTQRDALTHAIDTLIIELSAEDARRFATLDATLIAEQRARIAGR